MDNYCPNCGRREDRAENTVELERGKPVLHARTITVPMRCPECTATWTSEYIWNGPVDLVRPPSPDDE